MADSTQSEQHPTDCGCGVEWCQPRPNGTCGNCGGWLPGQRRKRLTSVVYPGTSGIAPGASIRLRP